MLSIEVTLQRPTDTTVRLLNNKQPTRVVMAESAIAQHHATSAPAPPLKPEAKFTDERPAVLIVGGLGALLLTLSHPQIEEMLKGRIYRLYWTVPSPSYT